MVWSLKKILKLKDIVISLFDIQLGNGRGILFWYDPWFENLHIVLKAEFGGVRIRRDFLNSSVRDIRDGDYNTLLRGILEGVRILSFMQTIHFNDNIDSWVWKVERDVKFNSNLAWESIRERGNDVGWTHVVWSSNIIPRQQFVLWLLFRKRLSTRDRLKRFMDIPDSKCLLCGDNEETMDHLFSGCPFTLELWRRIIKAMELAFFPSDWIDIKEMAILKVKVYHIWMERNSRVFTRVRGGVDDVWNNIKFDCNSLVRTWRRISKNEQN
ncbi:uncharacterized protein LOC124935015 [Impatiens glandulifera]|uniref:uncharacterized protein LOC124935015 n=1 Tax=Impatiens glandulifera TaxID=253017 RepID=UPI001FB0B622|nr:uncharacterized protein LOC124935015 [Impatiens glandulifera]